MSNKKPVILVGGGGHAKVLLDILMFCDIPVIGVTEKDRAIGLINVPVIGDDDVILNYSPDEILLVNGLGLAGSREKREQVYRLFKKKGYQFKTLIHPSAILSPQIRLGEGVQIMAGAVVQVGCLIGDNTVINTRASVDHDCVIGNNVHIAPGAILAGGVKIGDSAFVGAGATVIQGISIGSNSMVAAGAVVVHDVPNNVTVMGVPAKVVHK
ncbi:acetyltransferase [Desulforamulus putei]|uniref:UDP-perosamine 4-acetyltransferase n=1 Tax=Desulforamulus putei DSM 12395 TaxID=1121429 RepID=A0A1M5AYQ6_9FIRM|nr:acetyltransferase [Desulforamulus putei]SHF35217.1 UDP-perosamine 4-acetyltransferase [Desulforamulus putei DSM 12395]